MDSTTKQRYISTSIWSDDWFDSLSTLEKLVYFHLLTNEFTNAAGVYHFSLKQVRIDLDISRDQVLGAMEKFEKAGKAYYFREYIIIPKWLKHQKISERSKMFLGALTILRGLPDEIKGFIADRKHYDFPVEKYVEIPSIDSLCPVEDSLCLKNDSLCQNGGKKGIGYAKNDENSAHDSDYDDDDDIDSDYDDDDDIDSDYDDDDDRSANLSSREENPPGEKSGPSGASSSSSDFIKKIKAESEAAGFVIPDGVARQIAGSTDPPWLSGPHSYFRFVAEQLREQYRKNPKTPAELRNLYLAALRNGWESYRKGYPPWREQREAEERARLISRARDHPPETCPGCGGVMQGPFCPACGGRVEFRKQNGAWDFLPPADISLVQGLRDKIRPKEVPKAVPADLDF